MIVRTVFVNLTVYSYGGRQHSWNTPPENVYNITRAGWITTLAFFLGISLVRSSILVFYRRILERFKTRYIVDAAQVLNTLTTAAAVIGMFVGCDT
jgi:hypothetical protein